MTTVESNKLPILRLQKASELISYLRDDIRELNERLTLVTTHNDELQELIEKVSADRAAVNAAVEEALKDFEVSGIAEIEVAGEEDLSVAEEYSSGSGDFQDTEEIE